MPILLTNSDVRDLVSPQTAVEVMRETYRSLASGTAVTRTREAVLKEDLFRMRDAIDQYYADRTEYPPALENLVSEGYLRAIPEDPFTRSAATWQVVLAEYDPADPLAQGVFDVHSGASGAGLDGTPYAEW